MTYTAASAAARSSGAISTGAGTWKGKGKPAKKRGMFSSAARRAIRSSCSSWARTYPASILSSQGFVTTVKPAASRPCSMFTSLRVFTSPEPVPPRTVCRAPLPNSARRSVPCRGRAPSFSSSTTHSPARERDSAMCSFSRADTAESLAA